MTIFEIIILIALYLFAFGYMIMSADIDDEYNTQISRLCILIATLTLGFLYFPIIFAMDIWKALNKEKE